MPAKKATSRASVRKNSANSVSAGASASTTSARSTVSGPARSDRASRQAGDALVAKMDGSNALAAGIPFNPNKPGEYGKAALDPQPGATATPHPRR